jgi:uroporphyrinogen-III decarboxylase
MTIMKIIRNEADHELPFILRFVETLDRKTYEEAIAEHNLAVQTYSPQTQTSTVMMSGGTSRTYSNTYSGLFASRDDDKVSDC